MRNRYVLSTLLGLFALFFAASAFAQATRTWVSGVGDDANPCSRTAPCKTFAGAISKTASGGIIDVLDPGGFGAVTITKSITIESIGNVGSILASGVNGVIVNALATDTVVLRGLSIDGAGTTLGTNGVRFLNGGKLIIENCTIQNFSVTGVDFEPGTTGAQLVLNDDTINSINNSTSNAAGVFISSAGAVATLNRVRITQNNFGLSIRNGSASINQSVLSANSVNNVRADSLGTVKVNIDSTLLNDSPGTSVFAHISSATVNLANSSIIGNGTGLAALSSAVINSFGTNRLAGNGTDGAPTNTIAQK